MIIGYILVAVTINLKGDVIGKSLDYFYTKQNCYTASLKQEKSMTVNIKNTNFGINYLNPVVAFCIDIK